MALAATDPQDVPTGRPPARRRWTVLAGCLAAGAATAVLWFLMAEHRFDGRARSLWPAWLVGAALAAATAWSARRAVRWPLALGTWALGLALAMGAFAVVLREGDDHWGCGPNAHWDWRDPDLYAALDPARVPGVVQQAAAPGFPVDLAPRGFVPGTTLVAAWYVPPDIGGADQWTEGIMVAVDGSVTLEVASLAPVDWTSVRDAFLKVAENLTRSTPAERETWAADFIASREDRPTGQVVLGDDGTETVWGGSSFAATIPADAGLLLASKPWVLHTDGRFAPLDGWRLDVAFPTRSIEVEPFLVYVDGSGDAGASMQGSFANEEQTAQLRARLGQLGLPVPGEDLRASSSVC